MEALQDIWKTIAHMLLMRMNRMGVIANQYISSVEIISYKDLEAT